ncbi:MAG TPA: hypothetical protein VIA18_33435, partial [Polyangia bacterium]|nr:hypothetical protein [Polyangia bacterium]
MKSLLALLMAAFVLAWGPGVHAQHARRTVNRKPTKKRRERARAREQAPASLPTDEDDEMV